ncbi:5-hydroxytryptamine receptor-like [Actinia tenebrosa]|uniref:5-hydroxytryptamine receptor-like n=1 Tax=Actinia tenebrosa TaxID=6105 RepID=A0A6P8HST1_ACTTE|nr:5-hydroxytryptamine receptor-like [Actinia tenebrosa]XP_031559444.1 5-hydroxytryptamine receptor-like [Actinia tenebrosa]XP_031559445.1 5-hydroxytryptamine receptor-like [Actinia tenebrosa]XP_031559447.1 5-hydroxytryptamine receptor-like [Actinia tenebrosa]
MNASIVNCSMIQGLLNCSDHNKSLHREEDEEDHEMYFGFSADQDVFPIVLTALIIIINTFVLVLVYKRKALRTVTNYVLCSLAVSDLLTGLFSIPIYLACNIIRKPEICFWSEIMLRLTSISTVLHLLMVTMDRYLAIIYSLRYHSLVTKKRAVLVLSVIWCVSLFVALIQLAWTTPGMSVDKRPEDIKDKEIPYDLLSIVVFFAVPLLVMLITYSCIFFEVLRQSRNIKKNSVPGYMENRRQDRHEWKAAIMFVIMVVVFVVCWLPFFIIRIQHNFSNAFFVLPDVAEYILIMLRFLTSFINPCLYIFGKHDFRKALSKVFGFKRRPSRSETTRSSLLKTTEM